MGAVRLVHRRSGSVLVVPEEKAAGLATMGYEPEKSSKPAAKKTAKSDK